MPDNNTPIGVRNAQAWQTKNQDKIKSDNAAAYASRVSDAVNRAANKNKWTGPEKKAVQSSNGGM